MFKGLQVKADPARGYRPGLTAYRVKHTTEAAKAHATKNTQFGPGGLEQYYIPDYANALEPLYSIPLPPG